MEVRFSRQYLKDLYEKGDTGKKHRFQPQIIKRYIRVVDLMIASNNTADLLRYNSLNYEKLHGDLDGFSSIRVNDQYRIEFEEIISGNEVIASIVNITELSNHYK